MKSYTILSIKPKGMHQEVKLRGLKSSASRSFSPLCYRPALTLNYFPYIRGLKSTALRTGVIDIVESFLFGENNNPFKRSILETYDEKSRNEILELLADLKGYCIIDANSPSPKSNKWKGSFWDINYQSIKNDFYYQNYIEKFKGRFRTYIFGSSFDQEELVSRIKLLKGLTTLVKDKDLPAVDDNLIKRGYGIRGVFPSEAVVINNTLIDYVGDKAPEAVKAYLNSIKNSETLFPLIPDKLKGTIYQLLPQRLQDEFNSHNVHSTDDIPTIIKSAKWLLANKSGTITEQNIITELIKEVSNNYL